MKVGGRVLFVDRVCLCVVFWRPDLFPLSSCLNALSSSSPTDPHWSCLTTPFPLSASRGLNGGVAASAEACLRSVHSLLNESFSFYTWGERRGNFTEGGL
jgi:hypothetical protein